MKHTLLALTLAFAIAAPYTARADDEAAPKTETAAPKKKKKKAKKADAAATEKKEGDAKTAKKEEESAKPKNSTTPGGVTIEDLKVGDGMEAKEGSRVKVHYRGTLMNGREFDSNMSAKIEAIDFFTLDKDHLIAGWVEGIPGMKVHGRRKLKIPYKMAYGENGTPDGTIPPKADLNFEVELLKVE